MTGLLILAVVLSLTVLVGVVLRRREGVLRDTGGVGRPSVADQEPAVDAPVLAILARLGEQPGERATLVQFSSAFCAPCRATRRLLGEVGELVPGVVHVEIDAEQHLDVVRQLKILKTPTTLVLDAAGREVKRAAGQPRKADVLAALGHAVP